MKTPFFLAVLGLVACGRLAATGVGAASVAKIQRILNFGNAAQIAPRIEPDRVLKRSGTVWSLTLPVLNLDEVFVVTLK